MNALDDEMWESNQEKSKEIQEKFKDAYLSVGSIILELQPELSIWAPESSEAPSGTKFRHFERFHVKQGKWKEFSEVAKKYVALRKKHGITDAFYTFIPEFGPDMSIVYMVNEMGDSAANHYTKNDKKWETFGEEGKQLWEDLKPLINKMESNLGWANYNLSYFPEN